MVNKYTELDQTIIVKPSLLQSGFDLKQHMVDIELGFIQEALTKTNGNVSRAADLLGIRRTTLVEKIKKYNFEKNACKVQANIGK